MAKYVIMLRIVLLVLFIQILPVIAKLFTTCIPNIKAAKFARSSSYTFLDPTIKQTSLPWIWKECFAQCAFLWACLHWAVRIICCRNWKNFLLVAVLVSTVSARSDRHCNFSPSFSQFLWGIYTLSNALAKTLPMSFMLFNKFNRYKCLKIYNMCYWCNRCIGRKKCHSWKGPLIHC